MAYLKIFPIKVTDKKALDYITNPDKTEEKLLVSSFGCSPETADLEFSMTREMAKKNGMDKGDNLAFHLIQSFKPGEVDAETAHRLGQQFAAEVLKGKYEYVISTHVDKKHIHNHIIFNDVNFVDYRHSHINKKWYYDTRKISDRLCEEYGLSVIPQNENTGKGYYEYKQEKQGVSYKAQLKADIDKAVRKSLDYSDFLLRMEIAGYEVKQGKHISFRAAGRERFIRSKTLGGYYTEDSIKEHISKNAIHRPKKESRRINLIIDIQNCIKAQESKGYEQWAKIHNLKQAAKALQTAGIKKLPNITSLQAEYGQLQAQKETLCVDYGKLKKQVKEYAVIKRNIDSILRQDKEPEYNKEATRE